MADSQASASAASVPTGAGTEPPLSQRRRPREVPERFLVALSFSGAEREFVRAIAEAMEGRLGRSSVFFDEWFEFYIGGHDADVKLQRIYSAGCELAVVCVSATYGSKAWTRAEHEAIRSRHMQARADEDLRQRDRIFPIRVGDGDVDGILFNTIALDVRGRTPEQVAELIVDRLRFVMGSTGPGAADGGIAPVLAPTPPAEADAASTGRPRVRNGTPPTPAYLNTEVQALSEQLERARQRKQSLRDAGIATNEVDREILDLRRKLRDGGQLRAGDALAEGRYLLVKQVGRGGFAVVWEAFDRAEQRRVAIKVLHQHLASESQRRERFFRGARVMMDLKHPAVVRALDPRREDESFCYFVMEFVPGGNLREAVLAQRVKRDSVLPLILQVGEALAEAHRKQLIHRDIKPANILLDEHGNAKLTDFDLVGAHDTTGGTRTGALGTVVYAAPECLDKPQDATARADVYGLGMTAIFGLVGRELSLSTFRNPESTIARLDCSAPVKDALRRAVAWEPEQRFADAGEMVAALKKEQADNAQEERPAWAVASGRDGYGLWAAFEVGGMQQRMRWIPPGTSLMGFPLWELGPWDVEEPQHEVTLTRGYWLGETPVTQALWVAVMGENPSRFRGERPDDLERPVEQVSWEDCQRFLHVLNAQVAGLRARLPTEAEWERACRAGTTTAWVGELSGELEVPELDAIAWHRDNSSRETHPVGRKAANAYGLHDMLGNVWEWCADDMRQYTTAPVTDPVGDEQGPSRVNRGGSWISDARLVRAAFRNTLPRDSRDDSLGFRLAGG